MSTTVKADLDDAKVAAAFKRMGENAKKANKEIQDSTGESEKSIHKFRAALSIANDVSGVNVGWLGKMSQAMGVVGGKAVILAGGVAATAKIIEESTKRNRESLNTKSGLGGWANMADDQNVGSITRGVGVVALAYQRMFGARLGEMREEQRQIELTSRMRIKETNDGMQLEAIRAARQQVDDDAELERRTSELRSISAINKSLEDEQQRVAAIDAVRKMSDEETEASLKLQVELKKKLADIEKARRDIAEAGHDRRRAVAFDVELEALETIDQLEEKRGDLIDRRNRSRAAGSMSLDEEKRYAEDITKIEMKREDIYKAQRQARIDLIERDKATALANEAASMQQISEASKKIAELRNRIVNLGKDEKANAAEINRLNGQLVALEDRKLEIIRRRRQVELESRAEAKEKIAGLADQIIGPQGGGGGGAGGGNAVIADIDALRNKQNMGDAKLRRQAKAAVRQEIQERLKAIDDAFEEEVRDANADVMAGDIDPRDATKRIAAARQMRGQDRASVLKDKKNEENEAFLDLQKKARDAVVDFAEGQGQVNAKQAQVAKSIVEKLDAQQRDMDDANNLLDQILARLGAQGRNARNQRAGQR